jgi:hypothetical protein
MFSYVPKATKNYFHPECDWFQSSYFLSHTKLPGFPFYIIIIIKKSQVRLTNSSVKEVYFTEKAKGI